jgi:hypothetical protein
VNVPHGGFHIRMACDAMKCERVHPFRLPGEAGVAQYVKLEMHNPTRVQSLGMLLAQAGTLYVAALRGSRE